MFSMSLRMRTYVQRGAKSNKIQHADDLLRAIWSDERRKSNKIQQSRNPTAPPSVDKVRRFELGQEPNERDGPDTAEADLRPR